MADIGTMFGAKPVTTFMGLPACADLATVSAPVVLIGADACTSYASVGAYCAGGPAAIRAAAAGYAANLGHVNFDLGRVTFAGPLPVDAGDLPQVDGDGAGNRARIEAAIGTILDRGAVPVLIGGDDSLPIPIENGGAKVGHVSGGMSLLRAA